MSYRKTIREFNEEFRILHQFLALPVQKRANVVKWCVGAFLKGCSDEAVHCFCAGLARAIVKEKREYEEFLRRVRRERCCICGKEYPTEDTEEVPTCPQCLVNGSFGRGE